jgi:hypothetical protein
MSPVSKKRKPKKAKKQTGHRAEPRRGTGKFAVLNPNPFHEDWFGSETGDLLEQVEREWESWYDDVDGLEERACAATGEVLLRRSRSDLSSGNSFNPWFGHLAKAAANRAVELIRSDDDAWRGPACLLLGLASIRHSGLVAHVDTAVNKVRKALGEQMPDAFAMLAAERVEPTGRAWTAVDAYGDRFALVIETRLSEGEEPSCYLVAVELAADNTATFAGQYSSVDSSFEMWRRHIGASAAAAVPRPVRSGEDVWFLMYLNDPADISYDLDLRPIFMEYFRAQRRIEDFVAGVRSRGSVIPPAVEVYRRQDVEPDFEPFMDWLGARGWDEDEVGDLVFTLLDEWLTGTAPGTAHAVSPLRVASRSLTTLDMFDMGPRFKALMTEWVRYCADRTALAGPLVEAAVAAIPADRKEAMRFEKVVESSVVNP